MFQIQVAGIESRLSKPVLQLLLGSVLDGTKGSSRLKIQELSVIALAYSVADKARCFQAKLQGSIPD